MHAGAITSERTKAGRVYRHLTAPGNLGRWFGGWELTLGLKVSAIGTRVSEVRAQLPPGEEIEREQRGADNFYRIVRISPPRHQDTKSEISSGSESEQKNLVPLCLGGENSPARQLCLVDVDGRDA